FLEVNISIILFNNFSNFLAVRKFTPPSDEKPPDVEISVQISPVCSFKFSSANITSTRESAPKFLSVLKNARFSLDVSANETSPSQNFSLLLNKLSNPVFCLSATILQAFSCSHSSFFLFSGNSLDIVDNVTFSIIFFASS